MKKINKISIFAIIFLLVFSSLTFAGEKSLFDDMFKGISKDKKANDILSAMAIKYLFTAMGNMMSGNFKVDCDYKFNLYPSDYAKKITGVNKPVGSLVILAKGSYIMVSPNIMAIDGKSSILDIQTIKQGKSKVRVALPSNKIYTEVKSFDDIFGSIDKIEKILPIPKKIDEEKPPVKKEDIDKVKDDMKTEISYVGLNQVNNEKVHQIKFKFSDKKSKKEIFTILLDTTDPNYDIRRVSLAHKLIQGGLLINKLDFKKASIDDVNAIESSINSYKKVNLSEFKDVLYSSVIVNVFKLLK